MADPDGNWLCVCDGGTQGHRRRQSERTDRSDAGLGGQEDVGEHIERSGVLLAS
jgi:hypothetical protein